MPQISIELLAEPEPGEFHLLRWTTDGEERFTDILQRTAKKGNVKLGAIIGLSMYLMDQQVDGVYVFVHPDHTVTQVADVFPDAIAARISPPRLILRPGGFGGGLEEAYRAFYDVVEIVGVYGGGAAAVHGVLATAQKARSATLRRMYAAERRSGEDFLADPAQTLAAERLLHEKPVWYEREIETRYGLTAHDVGRLMRAVGYHYSRDSTGEQMWLRGHLQG